HAATQFEASLLFDQLKGGTGRPGIMGVWLSNRPQNAEKSAQPSIRKTLISMHRRPGCATSPAPATPISLPGELPIGDPPTRAFFAPILLRRPWGGADISCA